MIQIADAESAAKRPRGNTEASAGSMKRLRFSEWIKSPVTGTPPLRTWMSLLL